MWKKIKAALSTRASMATIKSSDLLYELSDKDLQELQAVYVGMLQDFIKICKENGICYMLAGGTALGLSLIHI